MTGRIRLAPRAGPHIRKRGITFSPSVRIISRPLTPTLSREGRGSRCGVDRLSIEMAASNSVPSPLSA